MLTGLKIKKQIFQNNSGFTLVEIMIAVMVFSVFVTAYVASEGYNIKDSINMKDELVLQKLCENKVNQLLIDMPELKESMILVPLTGNFSDEGFPDYEYSIEFKKLLIPDLSKIQGETGDNDDENKNSSFREKIFEVVKKNIEEMIWQVRVTVNEKKRNFPFVLSFFIRNKKVAPKINF